MKIRIGIVTMLLLTLVAPATALQRPQTLAGPEGFIPPPLHPGGITLEAVPLGNDTYGLLSNHPGVDNSGFIVGDRGVLVIDAHINGDMAHQIQDAPIVHTALRALGRRPSVIPGTTNNIMAFLSKRILSRSGISRVFNRLARKAMEPELL